MFQLQCITGYVKYNIILEIFIIYITVVPYVCNRDLHFVLLAVMYAHAKL